MNSKRPRLGPHTGRGFQRLGKKPQTSVALPAPLRTPNALPEGVSRESAEKSLSLIPAAPRTLTPRLKSEYTSLLSRRHFPRAGFALGTATLGVLATALGAVPALVAMFGASGIAAVSVIVRRKKLTRILRNGTPYLGTIVRINVENGNGYAYVETRYVVSGSEYFGRFWIDESDGREILRRGFVPLVVDLTQPQRAMPWPGALDFRHE